MDDRPESSLGVGIAKKSRSLSVKNLYSKVNSHPCRKREAVSGVGDDDNCSDKKRTRTDLCTVSLKSVNRYASKSVEEVCNGCLSASSHDSKSGSSEEHHSSSGFSSIFKDLSDAAATIPRRKRDFIGRRKRNVCTVESTVKIEEEVNDIDVSTRLMSPDDGERAESSKSALKEVIDGEDLGDCQNREESSHNCFFREPETTVVSVENGDCRSKIGEGDPSEEGLVGSPTRTSFRKRSRKRKVIPASESFRSELGTPAVSSFPALDGVREEDEENLEENAARMLSSRFDPSCTGFSNGKIHSGTGIPRKSSSRKRLMRSSTSFRFGSRVLQQKRGEKEGRTKVRRNYYRIFGEMDPFWALNRRIKVFWPLDKSWYSGHVDNYDEVSKLHHVKYDDRDEEWIDLHSERFKLLLLPSEVPRKPNQKSGSRSKNLNQESNEQKPADKRKRVLASGNNCLPKDADSEPIISWLSRSSSNATPSPLHGLKKKQKKMHCLSPFSAALSEEPVDSDNAFERESLYEGKTQLSVYDDEYLASGSYAEDKKLLVYYRKRFRKATDAMNHTPKTKIGTLSKSEDATSHPSYNASARYNKVSSEVSKFRVVGRLKSVLKLDYKSGAVKLNAALMKFGNLRFHLPLSVVSSFYYPVAMETFRLPFMNSILTYGVLITLWPNVHVEILIVDSFLGVRCFLIEGVLQHIIPLLFLALGAFHSYGNGIYSNNIHIGSIRFTFSLREGFSYQNSFAFYSSNAVKLPRWLYVVDKIKKHFAFSSERPLSELHCYNLEAFPAGNLENSAIQNIKQSCDNIIIHETRDAATRALMENFNYSLTSPDQTDAHNSNFGGTRFSKTLGTVSGTVDIIAAPVVATSDFVNISGDEGSVDQHLPMVDVERTDIAQKPLVGNGKSDCAASYDKGITIGTPSSENSPIYVERLDVDNQSFELSWSMNGGSVPSPNPTARRSTWQRNRNISASSGYFCHGWSDVRGDFFQKDFGSGPKKPRTQVSYSVPDGGFDYSLKNKSHQRGFRHKRIRTPNDRRLQEDTRDLERNLETMCCVVNVLVTHVDRGWRECGAQVVLELFDSNQWKLAVKVLGISKYFYKAHQFLQPGTTNRFTHTMMWKGGKEWMLEFTDRTQWALFKEMYEECYHRNIRAASVKNIPIPGVSLIEENDEHGGDVQFFRSFKYFRQIETDVEMALNRSRVLYDMDSDDEDWISQHLSIFDRELINRDIAELVFEKAMDRFEKVAYSQQCDHFAVEKFVDGMSDLAPSDVVKEIHDYWLKKRQQKGMPLIRHLQPPLWEKYEQQVKDWELTLTKTGTSFLNGRQDKISPEKPVMFAFCLKPRGLELPNKGSKHRSHRRISVSGQNNFLVGDHDAFHSIGRRLNGFAFGEERYAYESLEEAPVAQLSPNLISPSDSSARGFSVLGDRFEQNQFNKLQRSKPKKIISVNEVQMVPTFQSIMDYRNAHRLSDMDFYEFSSPRCYPEGSKLEGSDLDDVKLRNASGNAQHAVNLAKLKRERAQRLLYRADLAIHKAVVALMAAEAMKTSVENVNTNG